MFFFWDYWKTQNKTFDDILNWWDISKMKLKEFSKDYDNDIDHKEKEHKFHLQEKLHLLD